MVDTLIMDNGEIPQETGEPDDEFVHTPESKNPWRTAALALVTVILAAVAGGGVWWWQHDKQGASTASATSATAHSPRPTTRTITKTAPPTVQQTTEEQPIIQTTTPAPQGPSHVYIYKVWSTSSNASSITYYDHNNEMQILNGPVLKLQSGGSDYYSWGRRITTGQKIDPYVDAEGSENVRFICEIEIDGTTVAHNADYGIATCST